MASRIRVDVVRTLPDSEIKFVEGSVAVPVVERDRLVMLDVVRLIAVAGIVWRHAAQSAAGKMLRPLGTIGVPFFLFAALMFMTHSLTKPGGRSLGQYARSRASRLLSPFLVWSAIYVLLGEARSVVEDHAFYMPSPVVFYAGGHAHLWFLPYLLIVTVAGAAVVRAVRRWPAWRWPVIAVLTVLGTAAAVAPEPAWVAGRLADVDFWRNAIRALPTVFWALALSLATAFAGRLPRTDAVAGVLGAVLLATSLTTEDVEVPLKVLCATSGLGCVAIALLPWTSATLERLGELGRNNYGVYLSHAVFARGVVAWTAHRGVTPTLATDVAGFVFAFAAAATLSMLLAKSKWTRWTLGE